MPQHEIDLDVRHIRECEDRIARPVDARDPRAIEDDFFEQRARQRLQDAAFDLLRQRIGIDHEPAVVRTGHAQHAHRAGAAVDIRLECSRDVRFVVLVMNERDAAAHALLRRRSARFPVDQRRRALQHFDAARIGEIREPPLERIALRSDGELVAETFDSKAIGNLAGRANVGGPQGRRLVPMDLDLGIRRHIGRCAVLADEPGRDAGRLRGSEQRNVRQIRGRFGEPHVGAPRGDLAIRIERAFDRDQLRRSLRVEAVLVGAHPLHAHRLADRTRQQQRVGGGVIVPVHAVAAGAVEIDQAHLVLRQAEDLGEGLAEFVRRLARGPDRRALLFRIRDGTRRAHRSMGLQRPIVFAGESRRCLRERGFRIALASEEILAIERPGLQPVANRSVAD